MIEPHNLTERLIEQKHVHNGRFLSVRDDTVLLPHGGVGKREYVEHRGSAMIVPLLNFDEVIIESIYRYPTSETLVEFPAGMVDCAESTRECASRELLEETGYAAQRWAFAGRYFNAPAYSSEFIDIWIAYELSFQGLEADPNEPMQIATMKLVDLIQEVKALRVRDMRTAFAALTAERLLAEKDSIPWQTA